MKSIENTLFIIFGASGDLAQRKLIPALFELERQDLLPQNFSLLGIARTSFSDEEFVNKVLRENQFIENHENKDELIGTFSEKVFYRSLDSYETGDYSVISTFVQGIGQKWGQEANIIFYLSTPPNLYSIIPEKLGINGLNAEKKGWRRLIIEKPFGFDLVTAQELNVQVKQYFRERQIYRIDHYLGKETVQNLLVTRFSNSFFEPLWNRNYIDNIQITSAEPFGVGSRGGYYDQSGALRDFFQNHILQIIAHVAMEPPISETSEAIRSEKQKLFKSLRIMSDKEVQKNVVRAQYIGSQIKGVHNKGYLEEEGVPKDSKTETFLALKMYIDNWRWAGVPFYVRLGKGLPTQVGEIVINFKKPPHRLFQSEMMKNIYNQLVIRIQPDEGIILKFGMKVPGAGFIVKEVGMDFHYSDLVVKDVPTAYERLLLDAILGDGTLYADGESVEESWKFCDPILSYWKNNPDHPVHEYLFGTWGPEAAENLLDGGSVWRNPCKNLVVDDSKCEL